MPSFLGWARIGAGQRDHEIAGEHDHHPEHHVAHAHRPRERAAGAVVPIDLIDHVANRPERNLAPLRSSGPKAATSARVAAGSPLR